MKFWTFPYLAHGTPHHDLAATPTRGMDWTLPDRSNADLMGVEPPPSGPLIPRQPPPPDTETLPTRWEQRMTTPADVDDEMTPWPGEADFMRRLSQMPVGGVLVESYWPAAAWAPCDYPCDYSWLTPPGVTPAKVPCSLRAGHAGGHRFPLIKIRSRYGIVRAVCHLCDWSATVDSSPYRWLAWARMSANRQASHHLRMVHR